MNIKLLYPPSTSQRHSSSPILSLAVLKGYLNNEGLDAEIDDLEIKCIDQRIDLGIFDTERAQIIKYLLDKEEGSRIEAKAQEILRLTKVEGWSFVGFSIMGIRQLLPSLTLAKIIKEKYNAKIVFGGFYPQCNAEEILRKLSFVDYIVIQEGELALRDLLRGKEPDSIPNIYYRSEGEIKSSQSRLLIRINESPVADFTGLPLETYIKYRGHLEIPYELARGCSADCAFCSFPKFNGVRMKKMEVIISELHLLKSKYGSSQFIFYNAEVNVSNQWLKRFLNQLIDERLHIQWEGYLIPNLDEECVQLLKKSHCKEIKLGFETGSDAVLTRMGKLHNVDEARLTVELLHRYDIPFYCFFMTGYPHETSEDHLETLRFIASNKEKITKARVTEFELEYGTPMYHHQEKYKIVKRPLESSFLVPSLRIPFDEVDGLSWEDKRLEQTARKRHIEKIFDKHGIARGSDYCRFDP